MQLSKRSDQALRLLMYLSLSGERFVPLNEVARAFDVPETNLRKVAPGLQSEGWLETRRGPGGGVRLAVPPSEITVGDVVRKLEPLHLLECFLQGSSTCPVTGCCALESVLQTATLEFLRVLDQTTIAEVASRKAAMRQRLGLATG